MGDAIRKLFGGSKQESQSTSGPTDVTPPEIEKLRGDFVKTLSSLFGGGGDALAGIPKSGLTGEAGTAQIGGQEQTLLDLLFKDATGGGGGRDALLSDTIGGKFLPGQEGSNPFTQAAIEAAQRPTAQAFEDIFARALPGKFAVAGQQSKQKEGSSAFDRAAGIQSRALADSLGDIATNISFGSFQQERNLQQAAIGISQEEAELGIEQLQASALPRLIEQFGLDKGTAEFNTRIDAILKALSIATGTPLQTVASQSQSTAEGESDKGIIPGISQLITARNS